VGLFLQSHCYNISTHNFLKIFGGALALLTPYAATALSLKKIIMANRVFKETSFMSKIFEFFLKINLFLKIFENSKKSLNDKNL
jgi:hypothetical protein